MAISRVLVMLDMQNIGISAGNIEEFDQRLEGELSIRFPQDAIEKGVFRAYPGANQGEASKKLGWRIPDKHQGDWDDRIIQDSKSICLQDPNRTALVLCTKDGGYADLIQDMRDEGVQVLIVAPSTPSKRLLDAAGGQGSWIRLP